MSIKTKILVLLAVIFVGVECSIITVSSLLIHKSYGRLEQAIEAEKNSRIISAIRNEVDQLSSTVLDWSIWDDSYAFLSSGSAGFIKSNLSIDSLKNIKADVIYFYDRSGKIFWKASYDFENMKFRDIELFSETRLPKDHPFMLRIKNNIPGNHSPLAGLYRTPQGLCLLAANEIVRSDGSGRPAGVLVMGRLFDDKYIKKIEKLTNCVFSLKEVPEVGMTDSDSPILSEIILPGSFSREGSGNTMFYYTPLTDITGKVLVYMYRESKREIIMREKLTAFFLQLNVFFMGSIAVIIMYIVLNRWTVAPIVQLLEKIRKIKESENFTSDLPTDRSDEVGKLAHEFNSLMHMVKYQNIIREEIASQFEDLANIDQLTKLANRRKFDSALANEWRRAKRFKKELSLLMIDIDYFKKLNDSYGHLKGDEYLHKIAQAIKGSLRRPGDLPARYGGEEFSVILPETGEHGAYFVARVIEQNIEELKLVHEYSESGRITVSIGIGVVVPDERCSESDIIGKADKALYTAKSEGRNCIRVNSSVCIDHELKKD